MDADFAQALQNRQFDFLLIPFFQLFGRLNEHKKQLKEVTDQIGKPFPKEAEFQAKTARLAVLNAELDVDGKKNEQGGIS